MGPGSPSRRDGDDGEAHALAFSHALIVSYSRPFTRNVDLGAKRTSKDSFLQHLHDEQYTEEEKLLRLRDQVVAHSDAEASEVSIYSREDSRYTVHSWRGRNLLARAEVDLILNMTAKLKPLVVKRLEELNSTFPHGTLWRHLK